MRSFVVWLVLCLALTAERAQSATGEKVLYTGYRLLRVGPLANSAQVTAMGLYLKPHEDGRKIILSTYSRLAVNVTSWMAVSPDAFLDISSFLLGRAISFQIVNDDIQRAMDENARLNAEALNASAANTRTLDDHTAYHHYDDQIRWMQSVAAAAGSFALAFEIGKSFEGRSIYTVGINNDNANLPTVWIHGNAIARDWLSSATALYIIDQILTGTSDDSVFLRTNFRFFITPNLNPDGYEYTLNDRTWAKTMSANANQVNCTVPKGVFAAHNFDANFAGDECDQNPCSDLYCGPSAFSELETQSAKALVESIAPEKATLFISLDSFGQQWLTPYGYDTVKPPDFDELNRVALAAISAVNQVSQLSFSTGTAADMHGVFTGTSFDWSKLSQGFRYAYSVRTRPADPGQGGFDVPPEQIIPSGREVFAGLVTACREIQV